MSRDWMLYIDDMVEACEKIIRYINDYDMNAFISDEKTFDATLRNLEIIGEAAKHLPEEVCLMLPEIPWKNICGLRDIIAHAYFGIDNEIVWDIVTNKIPDLYNQIKLFTEKFS